MSILIIILVIVVLLWRFWKDFRSGLACSVAFLAVLPKQVDIPLPGNLPALTVHRLIVIVLLCFWLKKGYARLRGVEFPFKKILLCILITQGLSVVFAADLVSSVKQFLYFAIENVLFFFLVVKVVRDGQDAVRLVRGLCVGLCAVAVLAFIEKYNGYSPMEYYPGYYEGTVMVTFAHRILLGTAMAIGWPLCMLWAASTASSRQRVVAWLTALLCIASCYFSNSRGPWIGMVLVGVLIGLLGSGEYRRRLFYIGALALVVLMSNSGVRESILIRAGSTFNDDSEAHVSYEWRWELWRKAWKEINKSPVRMVLGYGPGASEALSWQGDVSFLQNVSDSFSSWDNTWAAYMLECGVLGFAVLLLFYAAVMRRMLKVWRLARGKQKDFTVFIIGALTVYVFMQTNVKFFAPQLDYIFWTTLAAGIGIERHFTRRNLTEDIQQEAEPAPEDAALSA